MAKGKNPRRQALEWLRVLKTNVTMLVDLWDHVPSTHWYDAGDGRGYNYQRPGRLRSAIPASEYRENDPENWRRTAKRLREMSAAMTRVAHWAEEQALLAEQRQRESDK